MTGHSFAIFDTAIGRCGIVWSARGINGVQLPMESEEKTRTRIRQRHGDIAEAPPPAEVQNAIDGIVELLAGSLACFHRTIHDLRALRHIQFRRVAFEHVSTGRRDRAGYHE